MSKFFHSLFHPYTEGYASIALIRLFADLTFIGEVVLKFIFPSMGVMRCSFIKDL